MFAFDELIVTINKHFNFSKDIDAWEKKMIAQGNDHLVRGKTAAALKKDGKQSKKE